jgi:hypothetical protein
MAQKDSDLSATKLRAVSQEIGYPQGMDPSTLERYYSDLSINDDTHFENKVAATKFQVQKNWSKLGKPTDPGDWDTTPMSTYPDYDATLNKVVIPAAVLQALLPTTTQPQPTYNTVPLVPSVAMESPKPWGLLVLTITRMARTLTPGLTRPERSSTRKLNASSIIILNTPSRVPMTRAITSMDA